MERFGARATPSVTIRELGQCDTRAMLGKYIAALQKLKSIIKPVP
jgi:hypothetical protein